MRKLASVAGNEKIRQVMLCATDTGVYVFPFATLEDGTAIGDEWYPSVEEADRVCEDRYGVGPGDWTSIDDPLEGCQHDWIAAVRVKGRNIGKPQWGQFERLEDGVWKPFVRETPK